ncbi:hypothetical protein C3V36_14250 [Lachnospiraceae bacterium oral taxon 500]|nr:hypothetical protein C3V36_14250 [Lachnospiraceae bacterium oral taxon 500]
MFTERLNLIMNAIEVKSPDLARVIGCDRSNTDRICKGGRIPQKAGKSALRIVNAIYTLADDHGKMNELVLRLNCEQAESAEQIKTALINWLYEGENNTAIKPKPMKELHPYRSFGQKLNAIMQLAELSNIRLGKLLNVDASYISRFRNGFCSPAANPELMKNICQTLLKRLHEQKKLSQLAALIHVSKAELTNGEQSLALFGNWLFDLEGEDSSPFVVEMIDQFGSVSAGIIKPPLAFEAAAGKEILSDMASIYYGTEGLKRAVIRFLGNVVAHKEKELFLYSDQNMDWMLSDPVFLAKWTTLMILCVSGETKINIIHNINRDLSEMANAIKSWMPLYPSGMIRSYYCKTTNKSRFSTTLFFCPGYACISGVNVIGTESENGIYRYDTEPVQLDKHMAAYQALLAQSGELIHIYKSFDLSRLGITGSAPFSFLGNTLSLATMPPATLSSVLTRAGVDKKTKQHLLAVRQEQAKLLELVAEKGFWHEYLPLPSDEALFAGQVLMDLPGLSLAYTPGEYAEHIRNIIALSDKLTNYRLFPLTEAVFENIKLLISENAVAATRLKSPYITFLLEYPIFCRIFVAYAERIKGQYKQDRLTIRQMLEKYL